MCGRYTLASPNPAEVRARFNISESVEIRQRYNVAPGDDVVAVTTDKAGAPRGELLRWGLVPAWAKDAPHVTSSGAKDGKLDVGTVGNAATLYVIVTP